MRINIPIQHCLQKNVILLIEKNKKISRIFIN